MTLSLADCIQWLDHLDEGATIWDTDFKFINRIRTALRLLSDEIDMANDSYAKSKEGNAR